MGILPAVLIVVQQMQNRQREEEAASSRRLREQSERCGCGYKRCFNKRQPGSYYCAECWTTYYKPRVQRENSQ